MHHPLLIGNKVTDSVHAHARYLWSQPRVKLAIKAALAIFVFLFIIILSSSHAQSPFSSRSRSRSNTKNEPDAAHSSYYNSDYRDDLVERIMHLVDGSCVGYEKECYETDQYAGYLVVETDKEIYYWLSHCSKEDYLTRPLLIWPGAGPGTTGLLAMFIQHGAWSLRATNRIRYNKFSWNTEANVLYLDLPFGVGFSVADNKDIITGDVNFASELDLSIRSFMMKFPHFATNDVFLIGASFSGHTVAMTAQVLMQNNEHGVTPHINFKGFFLGNPMTDYLARLYGFVGGLYGHGLLDNKDYDTWKESCWGSHDNMLDNSACLAIYTRAHTAATSLHYTALDWKDCPGHENWGSTPDIDPLYDMTAKKVAKKLLALSDEEFEALDVGVPKEDIKIVAERDLPGAVADDVKYNADSIHFIQCNSFHVKRYCNMNAAQKAMHAKPSVFQVMNTWMHRRWTRDSMHAKIQRVYRQLVKSYPNQLKMMIYNGDDDAWVGVPATTYWMDRIEAWTKDEDNAWVKWVDSANQFGGYYTRYLDEQGNTAIHYSTIHSAGHSTASSQPRKVLDLLRKFLYEL